ncbi:MAG: PepSY-associated TM helix domain-containing protein [Steroidobacteraceae bacterium]
MLTARIFWLKTHLYLGLFAGAVLALLGLTGSALVFGEQIDRFLNPDIAVHVAPGVFPGGIAETVERHYGYKPYYVEAAGGGAYKAFFELPGGGDEARAVFVDPAGNRILGSELWGSYFSSFMRELHEDLFLGEIGDYVVGAIGIFAIVSILTGLYLWWPRVGALRKAFLYRRSRHPLVINFEIHRLAGFYLAVVLFAISLAGIYLVFPQAFTSVVGTVSTATHWPETVQSRPAEPGAQPLSLDDVRRVLEARAPGAVATGYQIPQTGEEAYAVYFRDPAEPYSRFGLSTLWVDQYTGEVLLANEYVRAVPGDRFISNQYLLHNGEILGLPGQWLVFFTGLLIPAMYGTGVYLWWARRRRAPRST